VGGSDGRAGERGARGSGSGSGVILHLSGEAGGDTAVHAAERAQSRGRQLLTRQARSLLQQNHLHTRQALLQSLHLENNKSVKES
jgi:hypothetical protein